MAIYDHERRSDPPRTAVPRHVIEARRRRATALVVCGALVLVVIIVAAGGGGARHIGPRLRPKVAAPAFSITDAARESAALDQAAAQVPYVTGAGPGRREIALTFDDGPGPYTPEVLRVLKAEGVPATFFVVGHGIVDFGGALDEEISNGFVLGNHTENHQSMGTLSPADQAREIQGIAPALAERGVSPPRLFRPPSRSFNAATLKLLRANRMVMILWTVDTADYTTPGTKTIVRAALKGARPGAIVLMHDGGGDRTETVAALPKIIRGLRARGYQLVTVPQLLAEDPPAISAIPRGPAAGA